jgi:GNAT superfamily N-acetyltransferase
VAALVAVGAELARSRLELDRLIAAEGTAGRAALQGLVREGPMREALVWQNRRFVRGSADAFLRRAPDTTDAKMREYERVLATYLQRYCVKNETIGFFGPPEQNGTVMVGYGLVEQARGFGYATEALGALVAYAASRPEVSRIAADSDLDNIASHRVLEKCGFSRTGQTDTSALYTLIG